MLSEIIGKKLGMTQVFLENGNCVSVTVIEAGPCVVTGMKTSEQGGYQSVQLGYADVKKNKTIKPQKKHFENIKIAPKSILKEFRDADLTDVKVGNEVKVDVFKEGDLLNITGTTKGKGFAGVMKRHGYGGAPASRGSHESFRGGGSIGMCVNPGKVFKGKKMAGQQGNAKCTTLNLEVVSVDKTKNLLLIKGSAPGPTGSLLFIRKSNRK